MLDSLVKDPKAILLTGAVLLFVFLLLSVFSGDWHWFPRGGAMMALAGFLVSVREALLYRPKRDAQYANVSFEAFVRSHPFTGTPVFYPGLPRMMSGGPEQSEEELAAAWEAWEDAEPISEPVEPSDPGREIRDFSQMSEKELRLLRTSGIFGVFGTFIWAFGDLIGGLP